jgi:hypothetical protein
MNFEAVLWLSRIRQSNIIELLKKKQHAHIDFVTFDGLFFEFLVLSTFGAVTFSILICL